MLKELVKNTIRLAAKELVREYFAQKAEQPFYYGFNAVPTQPLQPNFGPNWYSTHSADMNLGSAVTHTINTN